MKNNDNLYINIFFFAANQYHGFLYRRLGDTKDIPIYDLNGWIAGIQAMVSIHFIISMNKLCENSGIDSCFSHLHRMEIIKILWIHILLSWDKDKFDNNGLYPLNPPGTMASSNIKNATPNSQQC